jgi:hypothetical protein
MCCKGCRRIMVVLEGGREGCDMMWQREKIMGGIIQ